MKFVKGMLIGSMVSVGIIMLYNENMNMSKLICTTDVYVSKWITK